MKIEIKNRFTGDTIISEDYDSIKIACVKNKDNLRGANLRGAYLGRANLGCADFEGAENYAQSHDVFIEICKRERKSFTEKDWAMIGVIAVCRICWDEIRKKFEYNINQVFKKLSKAGFDEWEKYYNALDIDLLGGK